MPINIEITDSPDTEKLALIHSASFPGKGWSVTSIEAMLGVPGTIALVAESYSGFLLARHIAGEMEILTLAVNANARKAGIASALMATLEDYARARAAQEIFLEVGRNNAPAHALYSKYGFKLLTVRENYYLNTDGSTEDAVILHQRF